MVTSPKAPTAPDPIDPPVLEADLPIDDSPAALALINGSNVARDVAIIPTIGQGAAKVLIENRPERGYASLNEVWELNPTLFDGRYKVDTATVAQWGG
jgi:hypothetical protein